MGHNSRSPYIRKVAKDTLKGVVPDTPPVPMDTLVAREGLAITESANLPNGSGYYDPSAWAIRLSRDLFVEAPLNLNRRRFTLAHELGHCHLEHGDNSCWNLGFVAEATELEDLDDLPNFEQEANEFARELLLPRAWLGRDWETEASAERWMNSYGVSPGTFFIVLNERRLLMPRRKRR